MLQAGALCHTVFNKRYYLYLSLYFECCWNVPAERGISRAARVLPPAASCSQPMARNHRQSEAGINHHERI